MQTDHYFTLRGIAGETNANSTIPAYLLNRLPPQKNAAILDFGCGFGQCLSTLRQLGYSNLHGADINTTAIDYCLENGFKVHDANSLKTYPTHSFDLIIASHVIEHIDKQDVICILVHVEKLLKPGAMLIAMVQNAQSNTRAYWAYEDFTHTTLYTAGSLLHVLRAAGFITPAIIDIECAEGLSPIKWCLRKCLVGLYRWHYRFWNAATASAVHGPSPMVFSYEIKAIARA